MSEAFYETKASVDAYIESAKGHDGTNLIEKLDQVLPSDSTLLEIGSGPGTDWQILNKRYQTTGSDASNAFLEHLSNTNPTGNFLMLDAVTLKVDQTFDAIYSNKVLHHLKDDELTSSIKRQNTILNNNGIVCHSFWKGDGSEIFNGMYVNYHNVNDLKEMFGKYFDILSIEEYKEFEDNDSLLLIARKKT